MCPHDIFLLPNVHFDPAQTLFIRSDPWKKERSEEKSPFSALFLAWRQIDVQSASFVITPVYTPKHYCVKVWKPFVAWGWESECQAAPTHKATQPTHKAGRPWRELRRGNVKLHFVSFLCSVMRSRAPRDLEGGSWTFVQPGLCAFWLSPQTGNVTKLYFGNS